ncbi:hypothetical protein K439DRAFT_860960 [Ramaria rubella]|nr:hypothetical protein K439DRAFT_860960 [Ramaria rubella]
MFYDYFLTLGLEVRFVWSSKWSLAKALYFATTYFNFINLAVSVPGFLTSCTRVPWSLTAIEICFSAITVCAAESVLSFRTWILWERNKNIAIGLLGLFTFLVTPSTIFVVFWIVKQDVVGLQPLLYSFLYFVPLAFYESVMLGLTVYKAKQLCGLINPVHYHAYRSPPSPVATAPNRCFPLTTVLFRDGILYYIFLLGFTLTIIGFLVTANLPIVINFSLLHVTLHSVLTKRMFLNVRSAASENSSESCAPHSTFMAVSDLQLFSRRDAGV